jgi:hypothetical protein
MTATTSFSDIAPGGAIGLDERTEIRDSRLIRNGIGARRCASTNGIGHGCHRVSNGAKVASRGLAATCNFNKFARRVPIYIRLTWVHKRACCRAAQMSCRQYLPKAWVAHYAVSGFE